ncbi:MAG: hypothetical protein JMDDDDMK_00762 [Acidobacteria bacterium]|nr:hypothetical protein [Acidobacteriota bacterium]
MRADDFAFRVNQHERRPGFRGVALPDFKIPVVDDRMLDLVAQDRLPNLLRALFVEELRRMHADDHKLIRIFRFELLQVGDDVHAVDAAVSPEIEQHDFSAQIAQADRLFSVEPFGSRREIGRVDFALEQFIFLRNHSIAFLRFGLLLSKRRATDDEEHERDEERGHAGARESSERKLTDNLHLILSVYRAISLRGLLHRGADYKKMRRFCW